MNSQYILKSIIIPLTRKQFTKISPIDADLWNNKWHAQLKKNYPNGGRFMAQRAIYEKGKARLLHIHRVILCRMIGRELVVGEFVDHINGDTLDNHRGNLRLVSHSQNCMNRGLRVDNSSGYKGVSWDKKTRKWRARIKVDRKDKTLGYFDTPEEAYTAYCEAAPIYHGEYARLK